MWLILRFLNEIFLIVGSPVVHNAIYDIVEKNIICCRPEFLSYQNKSEIAHSSTIDLLSLVIFGAQMHFKCYPSLKPFIVYMKHINTNKFLFFVMIQDYKKMWYFHWFLFNISWLRNIIWYEIQRITRINWQYNSEANKVISLLLKFS
jgi:hypothetical protein